MRNIIRFAVVMWAGFLFSVSPALALTVLKGDEARNYLGDIKSHILSGKYVYGILSRSHRDSMHGRFSDGIFFNPDGGLINYLRNKDGDRKFVIDSPKGREKEPVTEEAWRNKIDNTLSDDNPIPYVFLEDSKKEIAIVFVGKDTEITFRIDEEGLLEIGLVVGGARTHQTNQRIGI